MKALKKICTALMLLAFAFVFASCSSGSDSDDDDQSITLSDGDYTLAITQGVFKYDIKATASNESWTFNSGSKTKTVDLTTQMTTDELANFNKKNYDEKKAKVKAEMKFSDDAEVSFDDNKVIVKTTLSAADLTEMQENYKLSSIPSDAKIETITDKTEYVITMSGKDGTIVYHVNKD